MEYFHIKKKKGEEEFPCGAVGLGSSVVTAVAQVTTVAQVWSLARELPHAMGKAKKKKEVNPDTCHDITTWMNLEDVMLSETSPLQKDRHQSSCCVQ